MFPVATNKRFQTAFTLTELMIVVAIIGLLATIAIPSFARARADGDIGIIEE